MMLGHQPIAESTTPLSCGQMLCRLSSSDFPRKEWISGSISFGKGWSISTWPCRKVICHNGLTDLFCYIVFLQQFLTRTISLLYFLFQYEAINVISCFHRHQMNQWCDTLHCTNGSTDSGVLVMASAAPDVLYLESDPWWEDIGSNTNQ